MTLILAAVTPRVAAIAADRRYSVRGGAATLKATKIVKIETNDAWGQLAYAGVGSRMGAKPFELSQWVTQVLRGYRCTLDQALHLLARAATEQQLHRHSPQGHEFVFTGFQSSKPVLQVITTAAQIQTINLADGKANAPSALTAPGPFRVVNLEIGRSPAFFYASGSGATFIRPIDLIAAWRSARKAGTPNDAARRLSARLAAIVRRISALEPTVGPDVLCAWTLPGKGGATLSFDLSGKTSSNTDPIPTLAAGIPVHELIAAIAPPIFKQMEEWMLASERGEDPPEMTVDKEQMNRLVRQVSLTPKTKF